jgi:hypothetical protein
MRKKYFFKYTLEIFYVQTAFCIYLLQYLRMEIPIYFIILIQFRTEVICGKCGERQRETATEATGG